MEAVLRNLQIVRTVLQRTKVGITHHEKMETKCCIGVMGFTMTGAAGLFCALEGSSLFNVGLLLGCIGAAIHCGKVGLQNRDIYNQYEEIDKFGKTMLKYTDGPFDMGSAVAELDKLEQKTGELEKQTFINSTKRIVTTFVKSV